MPMDSTTSETAYLGVGALPPRREGTCRFVLVGLVVIEIERLLTRCNVLDSFTGPLQNIHLAVIRHVAIVIVNAPMPHSYESGMHNLLYIEKLSRHTLPWEKVIIQ